MKATELCYFTRTSHISRTDFLRKLDSPARNQREASYRKGRSEERRAQVHPFRGRRRPAGSRPLALGCSWLAECWACLYMDIADAALGKLLLVTVSAVFGLIVLWVNTYPFLDKDLPVTSLVPDPQLFLLSCAVWGLCFVGGLMSFTLYHVYPYL